MTVFNSPDEGHVTEPKENRKTMNDPTKVTPEDVLLASRYEADRFAFERQEVEVARAIRDKERALEAHAKAVEAEEVKTAVILRRLYRSDPKRCLGSPAFLEQLAETAASQPRAAALKAIVAEILDDLSKIQEGN